MQNFQQDQLFGLPLTSVDFSTLVNMPALEQQHGSLTPLEKVQVGILLMATQPRVIIETGVWRGRTTHFIAEFLSLNHINATVYGFDLPEILDELKVGDPWFESAENIVFVPGSLPFSLNKWLAANQQTIDFALVDAYHSFHAVRKELCAIAPRLSERGYIFCHDYGRPGSKYEGVMCAVNEVAEQFDLAVLPFWSKDDNSQELSCQAAILRKRVTCPTPRKLFHWRKYFAQEYPRLSFIWGSIRKRILGD